MCPPHPPQQGEGRGRGEGGIIKLAKYIKTYIIFY
jgi:hypothetical protein